MKQLHPGAKWQFRIQGYFGAFFLMIFLSWFIIPVIALLAKIVLDVSTGTVLALGLITFVVFVLGIIILSEVYARMAYNRWFYEFTKDNLKIEHGIIWKRYSNVPYERVQNVDITRGVIARLLGFSSVMIQTAGFSGGGRGIATEGYIPAVAPEEAEQIREFLMKKISKRSKSGL